MTMTLRKWPNRMMPIWSWPLRLGGFLVKRFMIDWGSRAEIMYLDLCRGLGLKDEDLIKYDTPLIGFDRKMVMLVGQIKLLMVTKGKEAMMNFIVVHAFSSYIAILAWPWIHAIGAVPSTLHLKVKFLTKQGIVVVRGDQSVAWQCLVAGINHKIKQNEQIELEPL